MQAPPPEGFGSKKSRTLLAQSILKCFGQKSLAGTACRPFKESSRSRIVGCRPGHSTATQPTAEAKRLKPALALKMKIVEALGFVRSEGRQSLMALSHIFTFFLFGSSLYFWPQQKAPHSLDASEIFQKSDSTPKKPLTPYKNQPLRVQTPSENVFWGGFRGLNPFSGGTWTLRELKPYQSPLKPLGMGLGLRKMDLGPNCVPRVCEDPGAKPPNSTEVTASACELIS